MDERRIHQLFLASILLKGAHALVECASGIALAVVSTSTIAAIVRALTQEELIEDPRDFVATHLLRWAEGFTVSTEHFYALYLLTHGVVKIFLVWGLLRKNLLAYPLSLVVMSLFIAYQLYRFSYTHAAGLLGLTVLDVIVILLIWHEYRILRNQFQRAKAGNGRRREG